MLAALLLVGLGIVSTMAFTFDTATINTPTTVVASEQTEGKISGMTILPGKADGSIVYLRVTLEDSNDKAWTLQMLDAAGDPLDVSGYSTAFDIDYKEPGGTFTDPSETVDEAEGYAEWTSTQSGTTVWIKLEGDASAESDDGLYHNIEGIIISAIDSA